MQIEIPIISVLLETKHLIFLRETVIPRSEMEIVVRVHEGEVGSLYEVDGSIDAHSNRTPKIVVKYLLFILLTAYLFIDGDREQQK